MSFCFVLFSDLSHTLFSFHLHIRLNWQSHHVQLLYKAVWVDWADDAVVVRVLMCGVVCWT